MSTWQQPGGQQWQGGAPPSWSTTPPNWGLPAAPPKKSNLALVTLIIVSLVAVGAFVVLLLLITREPPPAPTPPPAGQRETPVAEPTDRPSAPAEDPTPGGSTPPPAQTDHSQTLTDNALYTVDVPPTQCARINDIPRDLAQMETIGQELMTCLTTAWRPVFASVGLTWNDSNFIIMESESVTTACGTAGRAFYCSADSTVYLGPQMLQEFDDLSSYVPPYFYVVTHEFHHHVQNSAGLIEAMMYEYQQDQYQGMRRLELQDQCWVSMAFRQAGLEMTDDFKQKWQVLLSYSTSPMHGDAESTVYWGGVGLEAKTMAPCNTWTAAPDDVS